MRFIKDSEHYTLLIENGILKARERVWIATATVKDLHVPGEHRRSLPLLNHLEKLQRRGVSIRLLHGGKPSAPFAKTLHGLSELRKGDGFEMLFCPRNHSKIILVDGIIGYTGSANLTGAGMGARSERKRNFETGIYTEEPELIKCMENYFDSIWIGEFCEKCGRKDLCPGPVTCR